MLVNTFLVFLFFFFFFLVFTLIWGPPKIILPRAPQSVRPGLLVQHYETNELTMVKLVYRTCDYICAEDMCHFYFVIYGRKVSENFRGLDITIHGYHRRFIGK